MLDLLKMTRRYFLIICIILTSTGSLLAQELKGKIIDSETKVAIPGVNIFISGSTFGTSSDENGRFVLQIPEGVSEIIISHVSYRPFIYTIPKKSESEIVIELKTLLIELSEVAVSEKIDKEWERDLKKFENAFLGNSIFASKCEIKNDWVVEFDKQGGEFKASATNMLEISNQALGYNIYFLLSHFFIKGLTVSYSGKYRFEKLEAKSTKQEKRWKKNRDKTYYGSLRHFLSSLANQRLSEDGYIVHFAKLDATGSTFDVTTIAMEKNLLSIDEKSGDIMLKFNDFIRVIYTKNSSYDYSNVNPEKSQTSYLFLTKSPIIIFKNGLTFDRAKIQEYGYWGETRVAELLPINYLPQK